jgi:ribosomal protein S18 acetylase RimI-like enzyme
LLDAGVEWATVNHAHKVSLEVWPHNSAAMALYRRAGFDEEGVDVAITAVATARSGMR